LFASALESIMKCSVIFALFLVGAGANAVSDGQASGAALQKVIQMLGDMAAKAKQEKNDEQVAFAEFTTWCTMEQASLKKSITKGGETIELLSSEISKLTVEAKVLGEEIAKLNNDVADFEASIKSSTAGRAKENKEFLAEEADYGESVDAIDRAIVVLMKKTADKPALLQLTESAQLPAKAQAMITAFMGMMQDEGDAAAGVPEANAYEFQSGSIIDMLKKLKDDFRSKLAECQKEEANSKHAFDMQIQDLTDSVQNSESDAEEKTAQKAHKQEKAALDKKELGSTKESKAADEKTLSDMEVECAEKKLSFEEKQKLRTEEIEAIAQATKILSSEAAQGGVQHVSMAQSKAAVTSLAQFRGTDENTQESEGIRRRIREFLESEGSRLHNSALSLLAQKIAADPFGKVKKMIDDMITRLLEEANEDASHEGFCDTEVGKSKVTRAKLSEDIDALTAAVEEGKSTIMMLTEEIALLSSEVAELEASVTEATKMRTAEKATNKATVEDTSAAEKAITAAIAVIKKFYEGASVATAFVQSDRPAMGTDEWNSLANPNFKGTVDKGHKEGMQTFGKSYQGQQDEAGGVLAMLEVIQADFANVQADTKADEASAQTSYEDLMTESKKNMATKKRKIEMDVSDKAAAETKLQEDTKDMKGTQDELLAANRYYAKLVPQCFDKGQTFEERTASREAEIASLKQALKILG
jgi:hypothetical protein